MNINGNCIDITSDEHGQVYVYETRNSRILSFDGKIYQSSMKLNNINGLHLIYTQAMMAGLLFIPHIKTVTVMGLGAGSMVKSLLNSFPELDVHAVEYRKAVVRAAQKHFYLPYTPRLFMHIDDAVNHIKKTDIKSDMIFSDLFNVDGLEAKQVQSSYLHDCKNALTEQGVLALNICNTSPKLREDLDRLLMDVFHKQVLRFDVDEGNTIILAFTNDMPKIEKTSLLAKAQTLHKKMDIPMEKYAKLLLDRAR